jgi:AmmeMemoRadiSam system protein B
MRVADALAKAIRQIEEPVLVAASAEWAQFRPMEEIRAIDAQLLASLGGVDARAFEHAVAASGASMCGASVIACALETARRLGAVSARTVQYATSAEAGGDPYSSTGYAGVILS